MLDTWRNGQGSVETSTSNVSERTSATCGNSGRSFPILSVQSYSLCCGDSYCTLSAPPPFPGAIIITAVALKWVTITSRAEISRINSGKLLKAATLPNRKEWTKEKKPDKEEQEWLDIQIEKQERIRRNFDKWNREKESRMIYMQYRYPRIY